MYAFKKIKLLVFATIMFCNIHFVYGLTENSKVSILTYKPGSELYTIFGHTSLRVQDSALNIDNIYNFGSFDFSSPFFYIKFFGGRLDYFLTIIDYNTFNHCSVLEQRTIYEQTLDIKKCEREQIYHQLKRIYNSDERFYKYDFFYDNCATRIRDLIEGLGTIPVQYDTTQYCCTTFRTLLKPYISDNYWVNFGINLALGSEADKIANSSDFMFLPEFVFEIFDDTQLIKNTATIIDLSGPKQKSGALSIPVLIVVILLLLFFTILPKTSKFVFYTYNAFIAFLGVFILVLSLFSDNSAFRENFNMIWTLPALLVIVSKQKTKRIIEMVYLIGLLAFLLLHKQVYLGFSWTFIPWIAVLVIIYVMDLLKYKQITFLSTRFSIHRNKC